MSGDLGSTERELLRAGARYSLNLRCAISAVAGLVSITVDTTPEPLVTVFVVFGFVAWTVYYAHRFPNRGRWLVPVDVAVVCAVCLTQVWTVPAGSMLGITWVIAVIGITVIAYAWLLSLVAHAAATLTVMTAFLAGAAIADSPGWLDVLPLQLWTVIEAGLSRALYVLVRKGARDADQAVARSEQARRDAAVAEARRADEREYLAALHDTASATLLMVGSGVADRPDANLSAQAARDLAAISGDHASPAGEVDLVAHLRDAARHLPLTVRWDVPTFLTVPAADAVALAGGVREALTNVVRHAGVDAATVSVRLADDTIHVEVADEGTGFDPARVHGHRYGVTRSILERLTRVGGSAAVISSPGNGTSVRLTRPFSVATDTVGDVETIKSGVGTALRWSVVVMNLIILFGLDVPRLVANKQHYPSVATQVLTLVVLTAVTLVVAWHLWRKRPLGLWRWPLVAVVFAVSALCTASIPPELRLGMAHWSEGDAAWTLLLLFLDFRVGVIAVALAAHYAMTFTQTALGGDAAITFAEAVIATVVVFSYQLAVGVVTVVLRPVAVTAAALTYREERLRTERAVAEQVHRDRTERYAALADSTAPLLAALASGEADPGEPVFRRACAVEAARVRRLLAEDSSVPDQLSHELRACVELAERNGVTVQFAERGERPQVPKAVRRALTDPAVAALATAASTARVTVIGAADEVTVSVVADAPAELVPTTADPAIKVSTTDNGGKLWIKTTWRRT
ncbi:sensor histidine kinase [Actinophytocola glycyrrhizae]|uniref:Sensor histidine kinase n=1 Tax=Actinophytocola glycyrrhizae TaxID=2044873 RepID=A0ABV9SDZ3_9PSEU